MDYFNLLQAGKTDLDLGEILFDSGYYPMSAFCIQQALEKHVKAYLLKNEIFSNVKDLSHLPSSALLDKMVCLLEEKSTMQVMAPNLPFVDIFKTLRDFSKKTKKCTSYQILVWKDSLEIPLSKQEGKIKEEFDNALDRAISNFHNNKKDFAKQYRDLLDKNGITGDLDVSQLDDKAKYAVEFLNTTSQKLTDTASISDADDNAAKDIITKLNEMVDTLGYGTGMNSLSQKDTIKIKASIKVLESQQWVKDMITTYPHQTMSRYPSLVDGTVTNDLYKQHKHGLYNLISQIKESCKEIQESIETL